MDFNGIYRWDSHGIHPLGMTVTVCYWTWTIEIVDLPNFKMAIFHSNLLVYQTVWGILRCLIYRTDMTGHYQPQQDPHIFPEVLWICCSIGALNRHPKKKLHSVFSRSMLIPWRVKNYPGGFGEFPHSPCHFFGPKILMNSIKVPALSWLPVLDS